MKPDHHPFESRGPRRSERLRQRAAWMYYVEEMTQSAIADALGVGRVTVVRMLAEAKALGEVRIALSRGHAELGGLEASLCATYGFDDALVAPVSSADADATGPIGAVLGEYLSSLLRNDMKIGLGWGRTLNRSLEHLRERSLRGLSVVSLVGGVTHFAHDNPAEFPSAFARAFNADCYLIPSPALVDSPATKIALIERCGLRAVYDFANALDAVVVSVGSLGPESTIARYEVIGEADRRALHEVGAVGELLTNVYDHEGRVLDHPINQRVMSVPMEAVRAAPIRVLAAGGLHKVAAIEGAIKLLKPTTLVTDEVVARKLTKIPV
ncbi:MAG TPA: sugar-binding transcriptional regulator [Roseiarcus sp.]|nr:sugar-binding transcriptional regulator [Roseiarcus sp.]